MYIEKTINSIKKQYGVELIENSSTPVVIEFEKMPDNEVIISDDVRSVLRNLIITTQVDEKEIGFIIYGKEISHNHILLNKIEVSDGDLSSFRVNFNSSITSSLKQVIDENLDERTVVVHGHTHPNVNTYYKYLSLGDLACYMEFTYKISDFENKNMQLVGMVLFPDGEMKIVYYNPYDEFFYEMDNIK